MSIIKLVNDILEENIDKKDVTMSTLRFAIIKKYILDNEFKTDLEAKLVKDLSEKEDKNDEIVLEDIGIFMSKIALDVEEGAKEPLRGYLELKKIENGCKNFLKIIGDEAYSDFENWDKNALPYGFTGMITNRLTIKYDDNPEYKVLKEKSKEMEDIMKDVVKQNEKGATVNSPDGEVYDVPSYSYKASLVVKQGKKV